MVENISCISKVKRTYKKYIKKFMNYLHTWIINNPQVVNYTISNDLIIIKQEHRSLILPP